MHCPRCGQRFMSDARFCSRCGLQLNAIAEIVANDGLIIPADTAAALNYGSPRQKGMRLGGKLMFTGLALTPLFFGLCFLLRGAGPLLVPSTIFFAGLCWLLYSRIFGEEVVSNKYRRPYRLAGTSADSFVPLPERTPVDGFDSRRVDASDLPQPPSVTDHTTQFFD